MESYGTFTARVTFKASSGNGGSILGYQDNSPSPSTPIGTSDSSARSGHAIAGASTHVPVISIDSNGYLRFEMYTNSQLSVVSSTVVTDNNWHTALITASSSTGKLIAYLDGTKIGEKSGNISHYNMTQNQLGVADAAARSTLNSGDSTHYFTGQIDEFTLSSSYTTPTEAAKTSQSISFNAITSPSTASSVNLVAIASSGLPVSFTSNSTSVCTVSGSIATYVSTGTCSITASQAGDATYQAASDVLQTFTMNTPSASSSSSSSSRPNPTTKEDVINVVEMDSTKAIELTRQSFRAVNSRFQWLKNNANIKTRSHQGIRFNFSDPYMNELFNGSSSGFEPITLTDVASKLRSYGSTDGTVRDIDVQAEIEDNAVRLALGEMRETLGMSTGNLIGGPVVNDWSLWTEGQITIGEYFQSSAEKKQNSNGYTLTIGMDKPFKETGVIGGALTFGKDKTDIGSAGSNVEADNYSLSFYTGFETKSKIPVDFTIGTGRMNFNNVRVDGSQTLTGKRKGSVLFTSAKMYRDNIKKGDFDFNPYGLLETSRIWMDAYTEVGGSMALDYDKQVSDQTMLSFGADVDYLTYYANGRLIPFGTLEVGADLSGSSDAVMRYVGENNDYRLRMDKLSNYHWLMRVGFDYSLTDVLTASLSLERYEAVGAGHADTIHLKLSNAN